MYISQRYPQEGVIGYHHSLVKKLTPIRKRTRPPPWLASISLSYKKPPKGGWGVLPLCIFLVGYLRSPSGSLELEVLHTYTLSPIRSYTIYSPYTHIPYTPYTTMCILSYIIFISVQLRFLCVEKKMKKS